MCGRVIVDYDEIMAVSADTELAEWITERPEGAASSWNLKPTQQLPLALTSPRDGVKRFVTARWSLVPSWSKTLKPAYPTFNARAEGLAGKASFSPSLKNRRCAVPVSGFYEWSGPKGARTPHAVFGPQKLLALAGLYSWWRGLESDGEWVLTATILTRASAGLMSRIHDRMPVFLDDDLLHDWLNPEQPGDQGLVDAVSEAAVPFSETLREHTVAALHGDGPELMRPPESTTD